MVVVGCDLAEAGVVELVVIASGCGARAARAEAYPAMTALVVLDVVRRDPLATPGPAAVRPLRLVPAQKGA